MDLDDDVKNIGPKEKEKVKKKVVIDDNNKVRSITEAGDRGTSQLRKNLDSASWPWKIAACAYLLGFIFHVIAYATPFWIGIVDEATGESLVDIGIWNECFDSISNCTFRNDSSDCLTSVRVFGGMGVVSGLTVVILLLVYINKPETRRCLGLSAVSFSLFAGLTIQIGTAVFGRNVGCYDTENFGPGITVRWNWGLAFAFVSVLVTIATGLVFLIVELRTISFRTNRKRPWNGKGMVVT